MASTCEPLLALQKRMKTGANKYAVPGTDMQADDVPEVPFLPFSATDDMKNSFTTPTVARLSSHMALSPPPTPGRNHNLRNENGIPAFLQSGGRGARTVASAPPKDTPPLPPKGQCQFSLAPRYSCQWIAELGPESHEEKQDQIPFAPSLAPPLMTTLAEALKTSQTPGGALGGEKGYVTGGSPSPSHKLSGIDSPSSGAWSRKSHAKPSKKRTGVNARCA